MIFFEKSGYASPHSHYVATPVEFLTLLAVTLSVGLTVDYRIAANGVLSRNFAKISVRGNEITASGGSVELRSITSLFTDMFGHIRAGEVPDEAYDLGGAEIRDLRLDVAPERKVPRGGAARREDEDAGLLHLRQS